jgi:hypothetical protein
MLLKQMEADGKLEPTKADTGGDDAADFVDAWMESYEFSSPEMRPHWRRALIEALAGASTGPPAPEVVHIARITCGHCKESFQIALGGCSAVSCLYCKETIRLGEEDHTNEMMMIDAFREIALLSGPGPALSMHKLLSDIYGIAQRWAK